MYQIFNGDCLLQLANTPDASIDMVLTDPPYSSGGTGVACMNMGLDFYGIELDPGYFETVRARIEGAGF